MAAASIYQLYMRRKEGTENKHQLIFPLYLLSIFVYLLYPLLSISNIYQSPTQACAHTSLSHCLICFCLFNFSPPCGIYLCLRVSSMCSCDPCSTPLFHESGPQCHRNLGQLHKEKIQQIFQHTYR